MSASARSSARNAEQEGSEMATETDKMAAATLTVALLRPAQASGEVGGLERAQSAAAKRAVALYHEILALIQEAPH